MNGNMQPSADFDLIRLSKTKRLVDLSPNTVRGYTKFGLRLYRHGRATWVSKSELAAFIRSRVVLGA